MAEHAKATRPRTVAPRAPHRAPPVPRMAPALQAHRAHVRGTLGRHGAQPAPLIQAKLRVGAVDDPLEQEADRVADRVMRMPGPNVFTDGTGIPAVTSTATSRRSQMSGLQRKCACGAGASILAGECEECSKKKMVGLQRKLRINEPGDAYEQDTDRVADQVLTEPAHPDVSSAPPRVQRFAGQAVGQADTAPTSVDQVLASPGRPLEPAVRQDMEQRFGHDFSRVRVHSGPAAEQSAQDVNAHAYTVGHNMVFGADRFAPGTHEGQRLIAHELTHVVQQSGADRLRAGQTDAEPGVSAGLRQDHRRCETFPVGSTQTRSPANLYVARRTARPPVRPPAYWQQPGYSGPTFRPPQRHRPPHARLPQRGAPLTPQSLAQLGAPFQIIAIATFAPGPAVLQDVSWQGPRGGKFDQEGTKTFDVADPQHYTFAILSPPTSIRAYSEGYGLIDIGASRKTTWDGYLVPVVSDLDAALVLPLDQQTASLLSRGKPVKSTLKWEFLRDFEGTRWVPIKNVQIKEVLSSEVALSPEAKEQKQYEEMMKHLRPPPLREIQPTATPNLLRFSNTGQEVTIGRLSVLAERYPRGVDDPALLAALLSSHEFSFSGSEDARKMAAVALVVELREKERIEVGVAGAVTAPVKAQKRRRKCSRATGPSCPIWRPRLAAQNEYWNHAYSYRRDHQMLAPYAFNQNIAVLLLDGDKPVIAANAMQLHSEQQILWLLAKRGINSDCPILGLFSERKPCQAICQRQVLPQLCRLNSGVPFDVFFATDYYNSPQGMKSENNRHELIKSYSHAGYFEGF